ncbi:hypothetical protein LUR56_40185 [Streptomyces sp. MT29]|nr:hypothetical protein [Streptomyces sp. MT29]
MSYAIDLVAARREIQNPHGIMVRLTEEISVRFPAELPMEALDPILSDDLDLVGLFGDVLATSDGEVGVTETIAALIRRPALPRKFLAAIRKTFEILLGDEHEEFLEAKPSAPDYVRLTIGLAQVYGVELGKLLRSAGSSESDSPTSSPTSPDSTESTPDESGSAQETAASSASDA